MQRRSAVERVLPVGYWLAALVVVVVALPTVLRPPEPPPPSSAEFAPDAPPDDAETIVSEFRRGTTRTAGAGTLVDGGDGPATAPGERRRVSLGHCFGSPPRQFESLYAAACVPRFVGDNGGATYRNVSPTELRVGIWHSTAMPNARGPVAEEPGSNEGDAARTHRVLQAYWNKVYEFHGRHLRLVALPNGSGAEGVRATAVAADEQYKVFAATHLEPAFCDELVRRRLVCYMADPTTTETHRSHHPHWWGYQMDVDQNEALVAQFVCRQLVGRPSVYAGGAEQNNPRVFGVVTHSAANTGFRSAESFSKALQRACGVTPAATADLPGPAEDANSGPAIGSAIARFRLEGVTTIVNYTTLLTALPLLQAADANGYFPEWVWTGTYGLDFNDIGRLLPQAQMSHAFGLSGWEVPLPFHRTDCYRAYKTIEPDTEPGESVCRVFFHRTMQLLNGIQAAGPTLTPDSFARGMLSYGYRRPSEPYALWGGYGPGDWSWMDAMGAIWWDPAADDPAGTPGAFRWVHGGRRYELGDVPRRPLPFFAEGVTTTG